MPNFKHIIKLASHYPGYPGGEMITISMTDYVWLAQRALEQHWIPCSERMPKDGEHVIFLSRGRVLCGCYDDGRYLRIPVGCWYWLGKIFLNEVTHWMALPRPPAEGPENENIYLKDNDI